jgi:hypothetical protein
MGSYKKERIMMNKKWVLGILAVLLFCVPVQAELYKYRDAKGILRYTNDLSRVPVDQRSVVESYEEVAPTEIRSVYNGGGMETDPEAVDSDAGSDSAESKELAELKKMNKQKAELDKAYTALVKEKEQLVRMKKGVKTQSVLKAYTEKTVDLNDRISQYESRRQVFSKEVEAFNNRMK